MKAQEVKDALRRRHGAGGSSGEWVCVEEAFSGFSVGGGIDLLAVGAWRSAKAKGLPGAGRLNRVASEHPCSNYREEDARHPIVAYEVKVSRADMRRELYGYEPGPGASYRTRAVPRWPGKAHFALRRSHYFMFAVPAGLLEDRELDQRAPQEDRSLWVPPEAGLLEVGDDGRCYVRVNAPRREPEPWSRGEVAELIRHAVDPNQLRRARERIAYLEGYVGTLTRQAEMRGERSDRARSGVGYEG